MYNSRMQRVVLQTVQSIILQVIYSLKLMQAEAERLPFQMYVYLETLKMNIVVLCIIAKLFLPVSCERKTEYVLVCPPWDKAKDEYLLRSFCQKTAY